MKLHCMVAGSLLALAMALPAQTPNAATEQDYQSMLRQLHLQSLRPGASGNPAGPNPANTDEAKAGPFVPVPDPLRMQNGEPVRTAAQWRSERRPQLLALFTRYEYGEVPAYTPPVHWQVISTERTTERFDDDGAAHTVPVVTKDLLGHVDNTADPAIAVAVELHLTTPANAKGKVPVIIELAFRWPKPRPGQRPFAPPPPPPGPSWQQQILERGWGYAELYPTSVQPDNGAGLREGIIGLMNHGRPRTPEQWGALRAWAWGASRALDYLTTDPAVNAKQVGIMGHSRFGKAALVTMAYDPRFAIGYSSSSGAGGAALWRRNFGERLENVAGSGEYHWMDGNFLRYAADPLHASDLPVDQDELLALCAPRPVFVGAGAVHGDGWQDPQGMFLSAVAASPVYRLLGVGGVSDAAGPVSTMPPPLTALVAGNLAFRQHTEGHTPVPNWPAFLSFAGRYLHSDAK